MLTCQLKLSSENISASGDILLDKKQQQKHIFFIKIKSVTTFQLTGHHQIALDTLDKQELLWINSIIKNSSDEGNAEEYSI